VGGGRILGPRGPGEADAGLSKGPHDQPGAVEPTGRGSTPHIRRADLALGCLDGTSDAGGTAAVARSRSHAAGAAPPPRPTPPV
jgi:hypothetical protein